MDAGAQAGKLILIIKDLGEGRDAGSAPCPFAPGMIIFPCIIDPGSRIGVSIGYPGG
jgi:hypothetical protein